MRSFGAVRYDSGAAMLCAARRCVDAAFLGMRFRSLGFRRGLLQVGFTTIDWFATAAILYAFLPETMGWSYLSFVAVFVSAGLLGAVSGTPGGLGAFEATVLSLAPAGAGGPQLIAALVAYRMIFTVFPLCIAALLLALDFLRATKRGVVENARTSGDEVL